MYYYKYYHCCCCYYYYYYYYYYYCYYCNCNFDKKFTSAYLFKIAQEKSCD